MKNTDNWLTKTNNVIALGLTKAMSSMTCVYLFFIWSLLPLFFPKLEVICMYVSSTVIQLIALPLLAVSAQLLGKKQERRASSDHKVIQELGLEVDQLKIILDSHNDKLDLLISKINQKD